jgi:hypothetical protein
MAKRPGPARARLGPTYLGPACIGPTKLAGRAGRGMAYAGRDGPTARVLGGPGRPSAH